MLKRNLTFKNRMATKKLFSLSDFSTSKGKKDDFLSPKSTSTAYDDTSKTTSSIGTGITIDLAGRVDLPAIHQRIKKELSSTSEEIERCKKKVQSLYNAHFASEEEQILAESEIVGIENYIKSLEVKANDEDRYEEAVSEILEVYDAIVSKNVNRVIGRTDVQVSSEHYQLFQSIVAEFITIAGRYTDLLSVVTSAVSAGQCSKCHGILIKHGNRAQCSSCDHQTAIVNSEVSSNNVGLTSKSEYYRCETFDEYIACFQGRSKKPIPPRVYETIITHCSTYKINLRDVPDPKQQIHNILQKYELSDWYNYVNLIANKLAGCVLPNISKYEENLRRRHAMIEREYLMIREKEGRKNFLQNWYVLLASLIMEGYKPNMDDFATLTTRDAAVEHDRIMKIICKRLDERQETDVDKMNWEFTGLA